MKLTTKKLAAAKTETTGLEITEIRAGLRAVSVFAVAKSTGIRLEFTSFEQGPVEIYCFNDPKVGFPMFAGYATPEQRAMLLAITLRPEHDHAIELAVDSRRRRQGFSPAANGKHRTEWAFLFGSNPEHLSERRVRSIRV